MTYVEGFVVAVPTANKETYREHAAGAAPIFQEFGVKRMVEAWGDDVPRGKVTDFYGAVQAKDDETVVFSWFEYPSKEARQASNEKMTTDPRMKEMGASMPFDGQRMIFAGFDVIVDEGKGGTPGYIDGYVLPILPGKKEEYRALAEKAAPVFLDHGATRVVESFEDDVTDGKVTDYRRAVKAEEGEKIVFSWVEWPSKAVRDEGWKKIMEDERMQPDKENSPFDMQRMFWAGFTPIVDTKAKSSARAEEPAHA